MEIGKIDFEPPVVKDDDAWTVRVQFATTRFPQTIDSPDRKTGRLAVPAVHDTTKDSSVYLVSANASEAQGAYAYFLYHNQLGR